MCYFFTKKAAHFIPHGRRVQVTMRYVLYFGLMVYMVFALYQFWDENVTKVDLSNLCHTFYFLLPNVFNQIANGFFLYIGCKVMQAIDVMNRNEELMFASPALTSPSVQETEREIVFRKRAVRNMWIIIATIFLVDTYGTLYSGILFVWSDESCFI